MSKPSFAMPCPVCLKNLPRPKVSGLTDPAEGRLPSHYRRRDDERVDVTHDDGTKCVIDRGVYDHLVKETCRADVNSGRATFEFSIPARMVIKRMALDDGRLGPPIVVAVCTSPEATRAAFRLCIGCPQGVLAEPWEP